MGISLFMEVESFHFWLHPSPDHTPEGMKKKKKEKRARKRGASTRRRANWQNALTTCSFTKAHACIVSGSLTSVNQR